MAGCSQLQDPIDLRAANDSDLYLKLDTQINSRAATALVDPGVTRVFMHPKFARDCKAEIKTKMVPREIRVIDGRITNSGLITHEAIVELQIGSHCEIITTDITNTGHYPCVLGTLWLICHDPTIRWSQ